MNDLINLIYMHSFEINRNRKSVGVHRHHRASSIIKKDDDNKRNRHTMKYRSQFGKQFISDFEKDFVNSNNKSVSESLSAITELSKKSIKDNDKLQ